MNSLRQGMRCLRPVQQTVASAGTHTFSNINNSSVITVNNAVNIATACICLSVFFSMNWSEIHRTAVCWKMVKVVCFCFYKVKN